ncbi:MAG: SCP2 sterol-binding domain-containing protein [Hyphomonadaceae bacterium]|nr:SCP2 sterol-binding domain-containing protein [Hyphomonadaceae bacterium]
MTFEDVVQRFTTARVQVPGKRVKLDFGAAGAIMLDGQAGQVSRENGPADATLEVSFEDFEAMAEGKLDPTSAFMQQKLKVTGDLAAAMALQGLLRGVRA